MQHAKIRDEKFVENYFWNINERNTVEDIQAKIGGGGNIKMDPEEIEWSDGRLDLSSSD